MDLYNSFFQKLKQAANYFKEDNYLADLMDVMVPNFERLLAQEKASKWNMLSKNIEKLKFVTTNCEVSISSNLEKKPTIYFWPIQLNHIDFMLPVYHELTSSNINIAFICERKDIVSKLMAEKVNCIAYTSKFVRNISTINWKRVSQWKKLMLWLTSNKADERFQDCFFTSIINFTYYDSISAMLKILYRESEPVYHLIGYDLSVLGKSISQLAKHFGTPTGVIQHGVINYRTACYSSCDEHFLWDSETESYYKKNSVYGKTWVTGSTSYSHNRDIDHATLHKAKLEALSRGYQLKILVLFSGPGHNVSQEGHRKNIKILLNEALKNPGVLFVVKLHPKDDLTYFQDFVKLPNTLMLSQVDELRQIPVMDLISFADAVLTGASAASYEAFMSCTPVISLDINNELQHVEFLQDSKVYYCSTSESLSLAIKSISTQDQKFKIRLTAINDYVNRTAILKSGNPAGKIANYISQTILNENIVCAE